MLEFYTQKINTHVPISVIRIVGGIDSSNFNLFQEYIDSHLKEGATYILLDFEGVSHISSAGLRVVHNLFNKLRALHKDVNDDELRKNIVSKYPRLLEKFSWENSSKDFLNRINNLWSHT